MQVIVSVRRISTQVHTAERQAWRTETGPLRHCVLYQMMLYKTTDPGPLHWSLQKEPNGTWRSAIFHCLTPVLMISAVRFHVIGKRLRIFWLTANCLLSSLTHHFFMFVRHILRLCQGHTWKVDLKTQPQLITMAFVWSKVFLPSIISTLSIMLVQAGHRSQVQLQSELFSSSQSQPTCLSWVPSIHPVGNVHTGRSI